MKKSFKKIKAWHRWRRFYKAYRILRFEYEDHERRGHSVRFEAINEAHIYLKCYGCPDFQYDSGRRLS